MTYKNKTPNSRGYTYLAMPTNGGQSNRTIPLPQARPNIVGSATTGTLPVDSIVKQTLTQASTILRLGFPDEDTKYYMLFDMVDWSFGGGNAGRQIATSTKSIATQIRLPLPDTLHDLQSVDWTRANVLQEAFEVAAKFTGGAALLFGGAGHAVGEMSAIGSISRAAGIGALAGAGLQTLGIAARMNGIAPNQFVTILLNSPQYKQHNFTWTLSPKTPSESEHLRNILQIFNNAMAPGLETTTNIGLWWKFPQIFFMSFQPNSRYLFQFKPSVLANFMVDYSGDHTPAFFRSSQTTSGLNPPQAIRIQMQFLEIEYWKNGDFGKNLGTGYWMEGGENFGDVTTASTSGLPPPMPPGGGTLGGGGPV